jgi:carboxypeptidase Q
VSLGFALQINPDNIFQEKSMHRRFIRLIVAIALALPSLIGFAQDAATLEVDKKIIENEKEHSEVMQNLEYLTDMIGPRLTGSDALKRAHEWGRQRFADYGCMNAHSESWAFGLGWSRGTATGRILEPNGLPLTLASYGWAPGTQGTVSGELMYVNATKVEDLEKYRGQLQGKFVITRPPADLTRPFGPPLEVAQGRPGAPNPPAAASPQPNAARPPEQSPPAQPARPPLNFEQMRQFREKMTQFFKEEGVLVSISDSAKDHGLLNMGGLGGRDPKAPLIPSVFVTHENYTLLWRLLERKQKVVLEMNISNSFTSSPVEAYNTVAEIRGTEKPDEVVILGGHLDSWDLGTGTTDNGTGTMAILEACRVLNAVGARPKRTIRFIFFEGEEEGLLGSKAYHEAHKGEMGKVSAVLVMDIGTGRLRGIALQGRDDVRPTMAAILAPVNDLGLQEISLRNQGGTDHLSFLPSGVPAFAFIQDPVEYGKTHHSQSDTFDKAMKDDLIQASSVLAVAAYNLAQLPDLLPHRIPPTPSPAPAAMPNSRPAADPPQKR